MIATTKRSNKIKNKKNLKLSKRLHRSPLKSERPISKKRLKKTEVVTVAELSDLFAKMSLD